MCRLPPFSVIEGMVILTMTLTNCAILEQSTSCVQSVLSRQVILIFLFSKLFQKGDSECPSM